MAIETEAIEVERCSTCPFCKWFEPEKTYYCGVEVFLSPEDGPIKAEVGPGRTYPSNCPLKDKDILVGLKENHEI